MVAAVTAAQHRLGIRLGSFLMLPTWGDPPYYSLLVEETDLGPTCSADRLAAEVEAELVRLNVEFENKRSTLRLGPVRVRSIRAGSWSDFQHRRLAQSGGTVEQYKQPHLMPDLKAIESFTFSDQHRACAGGLGLIPGPARGTVGYEFGLCGTSGFGIRRLRLFPPSRGRNDRPRATVSHEGPGWTAKPGSPQRGGAAHHGSGDGLLRDGSPAVGRDHAWPDHLRGRTRLRRMNPFLRDEPPMLGTINSPTASSSKGTGAAGPKGTPSPRRRRAGLPRRTTSSRRASTGPNPSLPPRPRPREPPPSAETPPPQTASAPENGVRTTAHDTSSDPGSPPGVVLKPPVSLKATRNTDPAACPRPSDSRPSPPCPRTRPPRRHPEPPRQRPQRSKPSSPAPASGSMGSNRTRWR